MRRRTVHPQTSRSGIGRGWRQTILGVLVTGAFALLGAPAVHAEDAPDTPVADAAVADAAEASPPEREVRAVVSRLLPSGPDPESVADAAVEDWLERPQVAFGDLVGLSTVELCATLPEMVLAPPAPQGTRVNVDDRRALPSDDPDVRRYTYSAVRPVDRLDVVQVDVVRDGEAWQAVQVGFRADRASVGRAWLASPLVGGTFLALTLITLLMLLRPSPLRRGLARAAGYVREHRRLVIGTMLVLYFAFGAGVLSGAALPSECEEAVVVVLEEALGQVGATPALAAGDPLRLAVTIFYQNFGVVTLLLFWLGLLFGVPAYLLAVPQFFANGLPFGVIYDAAGPGALLATVVLIAIELTAYFLVVAGGGMLLATVVRQGFGAFGQAIAKIGHMLLVAGLLLLIGAWYEVGLLLLA